MKALLRVSVIFLLVISVMTAVDPKAAEAIQDQFALNPNKSVSAMVQEILEHYKQADPIGIPSAPIPEPLLIPPMAHSLSMAKLNMVDIKMFGISKFRVNHVYVDLAQMKCEASLTVAKLYMYGNYTLGTWLSKSKGPFNVTMTNVFAKAFAHLEVERSGKLEAQEIDMDFTVQNIDMKFENLGLFASIIQGVMNSVSTFVFEQLKPSILKEVMNTNVRSKLNQELAKVPATFPNSVSPFDQTMVLVRKHIRVSKYDPYIIPDYNHTAGLLEVHMTRTLMQGLSSVHRVGNVSFEMKNGSVHGNVEVGTQRLVGDTVWELALGGGMVSRSGTAKFTVEYIKIQIFITQSLDTSKSPVLDDIHIELGNIQVRFDGAGTADYLIEWGVNVLPNVLRYQIMSAMESPIRMRIQVELNKYTIEQMFEENKAMLDDPANWQLEQLKQLQVK